MPQFDLVQLLMFLAGTGLFMVAGIAVCVALMIFCDIINLGGAFEKPVDALLGVVFIPFFIAGRIFDQFAVMFTRPEIRKSLCEPVVSEAKRTVTV